MDLFFKNANLDNSWNNVLNWFTDLACTVQASRVPWTTGDTTYLAYDLHSGTESLAAGDYVNIDADIIAEVTGTCDIGIDGICYLYTVSSIYGGTFSGDYFNNNGTIYGGTFTGDNFSNNSYIYGGTFTGDGFNNNSYIYGGTFSGDGFSSTVSIYGGTFTGYNFYNNSTIFGGTFSGDGFTSNEYAYIYSGTFTGDDFSNTGTASIYGGIFTGANFSNYAYIYGGLWLERGSMDVPVTTYNVEFGTTDITGFLRITGSETNPVPYDIAAAHIIVTTYTGSAGFMTFNIPGQDVLGTGLI